MLHLLRVISIRRMAEHPIRTLLTILGIALGVAAYISVQMIIDTMADSFSSMVDSVSGKIELQISGGESGVDEQVYDTLDQRDEKNNLLIPGLAAALPTIQNITKYESESMLILAVDILNDKAARDYEMKGENDVQIEDPLLFLNSVDSILLNRDFAKRHNLKINTVVELLTSKGKMPFKIRGFLESSGPASAFGGNFALMDVFSAQVYFGKKGKFDSVDLLLQDGADVDKVRGAVETALDGRYEVERPAQRNEGVETMLRSFRMGLTVMALIVSIMGGFIIFNTVTTTVYQRMREIGILRMIGVTRFGIWRLFTVEAIFMGVVGAAIGALGGFAAGRHAVLNYVGGATSIFVPANPASASFDARTVLAGFGIGVCMSLAGAMWPSFRAIGISPLEVLRFGPGLSSGRGASIGRWSLLFFIAAATVGAGLFVPKLAANVNGIRMSMIGMIVCGVAATPLFMKLLLTAMIGISRGFRMPLLRMSSENILRDLGRSSMIVAAFMVAVAVMFEIYLFMNSSKTEIKNWLDQALKADLLITSSSNFASRNSVPMDAAMMDKFAAINGVQSVVPVRVMPLEYGDWRIQTLSLDFKTHFNESRFRFVRGDKDKALPAFLDNEGVLLTQNLLIHFPDLKKAEMITLNTPRGKRDFPVLGVVMDYTSESGAVMINRGLFLDSFDDHLVDTFQLYLQAGAEPQEVRRKIDAMVGDEFNLFVLTNREFKLAVLEAIDQLFALAVSLEIITILIALIGIVNNLMASVIDRTREIGVIRSLGATRTQTALIYFAQSGLLGFSGAFVGMLCGYGLGDIHLTRLNELLAGWPMPLHYSVGRIALAFAAVVAAAICAGVFPARKAADLTLSEALKYE